MKIVFNDHNLEVIKFFLKITFVYFVFIHRS
jgi:hypothetical protein